MGTNAVILGTTVHILCGNHVHFVCTKVDDANNPSTMPAAAQPFASRPSSSFSSFRPSERAPSPSPVHRRPSRPQRLHRLPQPPLACSAAGSSRSSRSSSRDRGPHTYAGAFSRVVSMQEPCLESSVHRYIHPPQSLASWRRCVDGDGLRDRFVHVCTAYFFKVYTRLVGGRRRGEGAACGWWHSVWGQTAGVGNG